LKILGFKLKIGLGWFHKLIGSNRKSKIEFVHKNPPNVYISNLNLCGPRTRKTQKLSLHIIQKLEFVDLIFTSAFCTCKFWIFYSSCSLFQQIKKASQLITLLFEAINLTVYFFLLCSASSTIFFFPDSIFVYEFHIYVSLCSIFICTKKIFSFYFIAFDDAVS
jgi:hypothetical protein